MNYMDYFKSHTFTVPSMNPTVTIDPAVPGPSLFTYERIYSSPIWNGDPANGSVEKFPFHEPPDAELEPPAIGGRRAIYLE